MFNNKSEKDDIKVTPPIKGQEYDKDFLGQLMHIPLNSGEFEQKMYELRDSLILYANNSIDALNAIRELVYQIHLVEYKAKEDLFNLAFDDNLFEKCSRRVINNSGEAFCVEGGCINHDQIRKDYKLTSNDNPENYLKNCNVNNFIILNPYGKKDTYIYKHDECWLIDQLCSELFPHYPYFETR